MPRRVRSTGPTPASVLLIGERAGKVEAQKGYCFCGPSGLELDRYLFVNSGLSRADIHVMNLVPTYAEHLPTEEEIDEYWDSTMAEVAAVNPDFVGLVGYHSAKAGLLQFVDMETHHGLCFPSDKRSCLVMPLYHPAAGLHQPRYAAQIAWDFGQFGAMVRGEEMPMGHLQDEYPNPTYTEIGALGLGPIVEITHDVAIDTEGSPEHPWCLSASMTPGDSFIQRQGPLQLRGLTILHHAIHDLQVLEAMGVSVGTFTDTMLMASLLGTEPLGLKSLARRLCGMTMSDYSDVIAPAEREKALDYLAKVLEYAETNTNAKSHTAVE